MVRLDPTNPGTDPPTVDGPPTDPVSTYHAMLANPTRRFILRYLTARDGPAPLTELDAALADALEGNAADFLPDDAATSAAIGLVHVHLPKLVEAGYVTWERDMVSLTDAVPEATRGPTVDDEPGSQPRGANP